MLKNIRVMELLGARPSTTKQAQHFFKLFIESKLDWILDFTGVEELTPAFRTEFFGKLADHYGPSLFERRLTWRSLENKSQRELHAFLQECFAKKP